MWCAYETCHSYWSARRILVFGYEQFNRSMLCSRVSERIDIGVAIKKHLWFISNLSEDRISMHQEMIFRMAICSAPVDEWMNYYLSHLYKCDILHIKQMYVLNHRSHGNRCTGVLFLKSKGNRALVCFQDRTITLLALLTMLNLLWPWDLSSYHNAWLHYTWFTFLYLSVIFIFIPP